MLFGAWKWDLEVESFLLYAMNVLLRKQKKDVTEFVGNSPELLYLGVVCLVRNNISSNLINKSRGSILCSVNLVLLVMILLIR